MIDRRALLRSIVAALAALPFGPIRLRAQSDRFETRYGPLLKDLSAVVLPEALGRRGTDEAAEGFLRWIRNYRSDVAMENGYGVTHPQRTSALPLDRYAEQLESLERAARDRGAPFRTLHLADARSLVEASFREAKIEQLPTRPAGRHGAADLMAFYFRSAGANDFCYRAAIHRFECRGLADAGAKPAALPSEDQSRHAYDRV